MAILRFTKTQIEWNGEPIDDVRHPLNIKTLWSEKELKAIGLERYTAPPPEPEQIPPRRVGSFVEFMDKFAPEIQANILAASKQSPELELLIIRATANNQIDLDSPLLAGGLGSLVQAGIISADEVTALQKDGF